MIKFLKDIFCVKKEKSQYEKDYKKSDSLACLECNHNRWIEGSGGGSFGNIECGNCGAKYNNLGPFGLEKIN